MTVVECLDVSVALERDQGSNRANLAPDHPSREHRRGSFRNAKDRKGVESDRESA
jgi:hypothetical protein